MFVAQWRETLSYKSTQLYLNFKKLTCAFNHDDTIPSRIRIVRDDEELRMAGFAYVVPLARPELNPRVCNASCLGNDNQRHALTESYVHYLELLKKLYT